MATENESWLTVTQVAEELGLSTGRIRQFIMNGRLVSWQVNPRMQLISREEVDRFKQLPRHAGTPGHEANNQ